MDNSKFDNEDIKAEERRLYLEYKKKIKELRKVKNENESVGQVFTKGLLPLYVLFILAENPSNGNDIANKIGQRTNGFWVPSTGGIYPILKRFEKDGLVEGTWDDPKKKLQKIYALTRLGIVEFEHRKELLKNKIEESLEVFKIVYDDLYKDDRD